MDMMKHSIVATFVTLTAFSVVQVGAPQPGADGNDCPPGQVWNDCGSACNRTCENPIVPCFLLCVPRCECPPDKPLQHYDYYGNLRCTAEEDCCPRPMVWNPCGSACPPVCYPPEDPIVCPAVCVPGCTCPRDKPIAIKIKGKLKCISKDMCPPKKCPGQLKWNECGSACTRTCKDPDPPCTEQCVPKCECPPDKPIQVGKRKCIKEMKCICKNKSGWKATVKVGGVPCKRCSCQKLKNKGLSYLKKACENNIRNARRNCCKLCKANGYPYQNW